MDVPFLSCPTLLPDPSFLDKGAYLIHRPAHGQHLTNRAKQVSTDQPPLGRWVLTNHHQAGRFCSVTTRQVGADQSPSSRQVLTNPQPAWVILTSHQHRWILTNTCETRAPEAARPTPRCACGLDGVWGRPRPYVQKLEALRVEGHGRLSLGVGHRQFEIALREEGLPRRWAFSHPAWIVGVIALFLH